MSSSVKTSGTPQPSAAGKAVKTPCIGICSTTSFGDLVCRGCKRYGFEVIAWNAYSADEKRAVLSRLEQLQCQILGTRLEILSEADLQAGLRRLSIPFDSSLNPLCWVHNLLRKGHLQIQRLEDFGLRATGEYAGQTVAQFCAQIEEELKSLSEAHYQRYLKPK